MAFAAHRFAGKHVLITGATQGIGAGIANYFHHLGADVTAVGLDKGDGSLAEGIRIELADVSNADDITRLFADLKQLDDVINYEGIIRRHDEHQLDVFEKVLDINLTGTMRICDAARPLLKESHGTIVNMASMLSFFGGSLVPAYAASKGGVAQLTKSLAIAYATD